MRIFFRKHGNSLFYIFLPVLFLALTVAFIQLTPKPSQSEVSQECVVNDDCCNVSGECGPFDAQEACNKGICVQTNVFCANGAAPEVNTENGECTCPAENNQDGLLQPCEQCPQGTANDIQDGRGCLPYCQENEDPIADNCIDGGIQGDGQKIGGCGSNSLHPSNAGSNNMAVYLVFALGLAGFFPALRRKIQG